MYDPLGLCGSEWYDKLLKWAQSESAFSKDYLDNNVSPWLAATLESLGDVGTGILSLPAQLGHLGEATGNTGYIGDEPLLQPISNLGTGAGTYAGDPTLANFAGLAMDLSTVVGAAAGLNSLGGAAAVQSEVQLEFDFVKGNLSGSLSRWTFAAEETVPIYRGVGETINGITPNPAYQTALEGTAIPRGWPNGVDNPIAHIGGATENSVYTSWTLERSVAFEHATKYGDGVILRLEVPGSQVGPIWQNYNEAETLLKGPVAGAKPTKVQGF